MVVETPFQFFRFVLVAFILLHLAALLVSSALHGVYARGAVTRKHESAQRTRRLVGLNRAYHLLRPHQRELLEIGVLSMVLLALVIAHF